MSISRRDFLSGAAAAAASAGLPPTLQPEATAIKSARRVAPSIAFYRHGISLNNGQTMYATYEVLKDGVIRIDEDTLAPGEILSFCANGLGALFNISTPRQDDDERHRPAHFDIAPGNEHYEAALIAARSNLAGAFF